MERYIISIERAAEATYFLKLLYQIKGNKLEKINEVIYPNCNKLKIIARRGEYDINGVYDSNIEILDTVDVAILKIQNFEDLKEDSNYIETSEISSKYFTYLNKIILEYLDEEICEVIDFNDIIFDFFKFKHEEVPLILDSEPLTPKIYFEFKNNIYGPVKYELKEGKYFFKVLDSVGNYTNKYNLENLTDIIYEINTKNFIKKIIMSNEIKNRNGIEEEKEDFMKRDLIINKFINQIKNDGNLSKNDGVLLKEKLKKDTIFLSEERKKIIEDKINENEIYLQIKEKIIKDILNDEEKLKNICKKIATENFSEIQKNSDISSIIQELNNKKIEEEKKLDDLKYKIEEEEKKLQEILKNREKELEIHNDNKLKDLKNQLLEKTEELNSLGIKIKEKEEEYENKLKKLNVVNDLNKLEEENKYLSRKKEDINTEIKDLENKITDLKKEAEKYSKEGLEGHTLLLKEAIENIKKEYRNNYFDFFTFNKLEEIENRQYQEELKNEFLKCLDQREKIKEIDVSEFIIDQLEYFDKKANRKLDRNDLINILLCLSQGFLTIFAGEPGSGKTSLCRIIGKALGLYTKENSRYLEVSVEKGWTSKRDFIGYYNPLTKQIDYTNQKIFDSLRRLDFEERKNINDYPFIFTLDEANLSPMEYYWADFMNVCEMEENEERVINIGDDYSYLLPKTLRFLATINYDHTTEVLSPRLIDRAWIILLENNEIDISNLKSIVLEVSKEKIPYYIFEELKNVANKKLSPTLENRFREIIEYLKVKNIVVSPRVQKMIKNYCIKGNELFEKGKNDLISLDYAVSQKLLPLLEGYGDEYREFLKIFCEVQLSGMDKCQKIVENIILKGDKNMKHYYFFQR